MYILGVRRNTMKFVFNDHTDQKVALANEWYIVYRLNRFYIVTKNHNNIVANCGSLGMAMELGVQLLR